MEAVGVRVMGDELGSAAPGNCDLWVVLGGGGGVDADSWR